MVAQPGQNYKAPAQAGPTFTPCPAPSPDPSALTAALALERLGLSVIPLLPGSKIAARRWRRWERERPTPALLRRWWRENPAFGVGVVCGRVSGVVSLDCDGPEGQAALEGRHLPPTAILLTPRGHQRLFALPPGVTLPPTRIGLLLQVDLLAEGHYSAVVVSDGRAWAPGLSPEEVGFAPCPEWLLTLAQEPPQRPQAAPGGPDDTLPWQLPAGAKEGERHDTLTRIVGRLLAAGVSEAQVEARALTWAETCTPPLPEEETRAVAASLARAEAAKPPGSRGVRIPRTLLRRGLGEGALLLAAQLLAYAQEGRRPPAWRVIGADLGADPSTVWRWRQDLAQAGVTPETLEQRPRQRYFTVSRAVLFATGLSRGQRVTALHLASFAEGGAAQVGQVLLAQARGLSERQLRRHLRALEAAGHLETTRAAYDPALGKRPCGNTYSFAEAPNVARVAGSLRPWIQSERESGSGTSGTPAVAARARREEVQPDREAILEREAPWNPLPETRKARIARKIRGLETRLEEERQYTATGQAPARLLHRTPHEYWPPGEERCTGDRAERPPGEAPDPLEVLPVTVTTERDRRLLAALREKVRYATVETLLSRHGLERTAEELLGPEVVSSL